MSSGEIGTWVGNGIMLISLILFIIAERDRFTPRRNERARVPIPTTLSDNGFSDALRALIYPRILLGLILGYAINRLLLWVFQDFGRLEGFISRLTNSILVLQVLSSSALAILIGGFFTLVYLKYSPNLNATYLRGLERVLIAFVLLSGLIAPYQLRWNGMENVVYGPIPFVAMLVGVIIMLLLSFPMSPIELIITVVRQLGVSRKGGSAG